MSEEFNADVEIVSRIPAVPTILDVVCRTTGMGFAAVARVTDERWIACSVLDRIDFGLKPGGELQVETTICHEVRQGREPVLIDHVAEDDAWREHACPARYGFQSYVSVPIILADGSFFGTLCAIDPRPARVKTPEVIGMITLFAELIAKHIDGARKLAETESALSEERALAELREEFMAVLGHDLRAPIRAIHCFSELIMREPLEENVSRMAQVVHGSAIRMRSLTDNLLDLTRCRLGDGLGLSRGTKKPLEPELRAVIAELTAPEPGRIVEATFALTQPVDCDPSRITQLFSNLLGNALQYGAASQPIRVSAWSDAEHFELWVANAGEPIPPAALERLFQPFYRGSARSREGLGLGLYIAYQIAKSHGGTLSVHSTPQETRFTFRMPTK